MKGEIYYRTSCNKRLLRFWNRHEIMSFQPAKSTPPHLFFDRTFPVLFYKNFVNHLQIQSKLREVTKLLRSGGQGHPIPIYVVRSSTPCWPAHPALPSNHRQNAAPHRRCRWRRHEGATMVATILKGNEKEIKTSTDGTILRAEAGPQALAPPYSLLCSNNFNTLCGDWHLKWVQVAPPWQFMNFYLEHP